MVKTAILQVRLDKLREYRRILDDLATTPKERFLSDPREHAAVERYLHLASECMLDVASHLVADLALPQAQTYAELFERLRDAGQLEPDLAIRLIEWARFRNILVHAYVNLDLEIVYRVLHERLGDLDSFMGVAVRYLTETEPG